MPKFIESRQVLEKKPEKMCLHCGSTRSISSFYANRDWVDQEGRDCWCNECFKKLNNKQEVRHYFWDNNREWKDTIWQSARKKAISVISDNPTYVKSSEQRKAIMLDKMTIQMLPQIMNLPTMYKYVDNNALSGSLTFEEAKKKNIIPEEIDPFAKTYSAEWDGSFTQKELSFLNGYYKDLQKDFNFTDASTIDYAKKVCRASMQVDRTMDDFANGRCDYAAVKDAVNVFDMLSKSANLAACKRKEDDESADDTCWSLTAEYCQTHGYPMTNKIQWEKDDVDIAIDSLKHLAVALNLDSV